MKKIAALVLLGSFTSSLAYSCELEDINYLAFQNSGYIDFVQTKKVAALSRPLISTGTIWLSSDSELVWQTLVPLKSTLLITTDGLKQYNKNDILQTEINAPVALDLATIFLNILQGDFASLQESFSVSLECEGEQWQLQLEPNNTQLNNIISSIEISGNEFLRSIDFQEQRGDVTELQLSEPRLEPAMNFEIYLEN